MNVDEFYQSRRQEWELLNTLVERAQKAPQRLSTADIARMAGMYRAASSDLALAKRDFPRHRITRYLNQVVARAHSVLYQGEPHLRLFLAGVSASFPGNIYLHLHRLSDVCDPRNYRRGCHGCLSRIRCLAAAGRGSESHSDY